jgi:hypothetical protein
MNRDATDELSAPRTLFLPDPKTAPRVREFKNSRVQGFKGSRVQGFKGARVQEFKSSRV